MSNGIYDLVMSDGGPRGSGRRLRGAASALILFALAGLLSGCAWFTGWVELNGGLVDGGGSYLPCCVAQRIISRSQRPTRNVGSVSGTGCVAVWSQGCVEVHGGDQCPRLPRHPHSGSEGDRSFLPWGTGLLRVVAESAGVMHPSWSATTEAPVVLCCATGAG